MLKPLAVAGPQEERDQRGEEGAVRGDRPADGRAALAEGSDELVGSDTARALGLPPHQLESLAAGQRVELDRRVERYRRGAPLPDLVGRDVILVDDGLATGVTAEAALRALRKHKPL